MASALKTSFSISGPNQTLTKSRVNGSPLASPSLVSLQFADSRSGESMALNLSDRQGLSSPNGSSPKHKSIRAQASICVSRAMRWWEKTRTPNMVEIHSAQELVDSLLNAGDRLVIIDFYSPGCGGCKSLHPKICQLADSNPDAVFLKVNYEELKTMCHSLHIHVLPFFRFYRGAEGKLCSFSCTNATIKKFKDALAKYGTERCSLGPAKGLDESELLSLASIGELSMNLSLKSSKEEASMEDLVLQAMDLPFKEGNEMGLKEEGAFSMA